MGPYGTKRGDDRSEKTDKEHRFGGEKDWWVTGILNTRYLNCKKTKISNLKHRVPGKSKKEKIDSIEKERRLKFRKD